MRIEISMDDVANFAHDENSGSGVGRSGPEVDTMNGGSQREPSSWMEFAALVPMSYLFKRRSRLAIHMPIRQQWTLENSYRL